MSGPAKGSGDFALRRNVGILDCHGRVLFQTRTNVASVKSLVLTVESLTGFMRRRSSTAVKLVNSTGPAVASFEEIQFGIIRENVSVSKLIRRFLDEY